MNRFDKAYFYGLSLFLFGSVISFISYQSIAPFVFGGICFTSSLIVLSLSRLGGKSERRMFSVVFGTCFFMAGVAAIFANQLQDEGQIFSDPESFFEMASGNASGLSLTQIQIIHEGSLSIVLWRFIYDLFGALGFEQLRHFGITVNVTLVALSGVVGIKILRQIFGDDEYRFRRLTLLVASCGMFWLFGGIHLRDALILFWVTTLSYAWVWFINNEKLGVRLVQIIFYNFVGVAGFYFLRSEFVFVPGAMAVAGIAALLVGRTQYRSRWRIYVVLIVSSSILIPLGIAFSSSVLEGFTTGLTEYSELSAREHSSSSLGVAFIGNQRPAIKLIVGSMYLFVYPIPFWSGFQLSSAYNLFKSINVIYIYFVAPLLVMLLQDGNLGLVLRSVIIRFILFLSIGMTGLVALTSMETRHIGVFFLPIMILATVADLRPFRARQNYNNILTVTLSCVALVHLVWIRLKM